MLASRTSDPLENVWTNNPFEGDAALENSAYAGFHGDTLVRLLETSPPSASEIVVHGSFRRFVEDPDFSCLGARAAIHRGTYRFGLYRRLADAEVSAGLARDLFAFAEERRRFPATFNAYVASFREPVEDEAEFERLLWAQLGQLHELDRSRFPWDESVSSDPNDPDFSFSFAGQALFVVGLHPAASRHARRFAWPTLVFNPHEQFDDLKRSGGYDGLQSKIRVREHSLQGSLNPNLAPFGETSEARQYSGRPVPKGWKCPFRPSN